MATSYGSSRLERGFSSISETDTASELGQETARAQGERVIPSQMILDQKIKITQSDH
ncbi:hypothetical protein PSET11_00271 [Arthrobacter ulcerisalmonis]|uniref:Uncharacterized protein n=1 Tax=Arthrobacter ulcerisalmonis TaxID=2483813 RepID=A0A3P5WTE0_9MICC|nr:hypothetical protein PSET11_00271 [Arthrobacter ulcerisalmonis]